MVVQKIAREILRPFRQLHRATVRTPSPPPRKAPRRPRVERGNYPQDFSAQDIALIEAVVPYTMTSLERLCVLARAVEHVARTGIPGDIVECGVWKGGSMMAAALTLLRLGDTRRTLHLVDTFEGMPPAADVDRDWAGRSADENRETSRWATSTSWCEAGLEEVQKNLRSTNYPADRMRFVRGLVEETIPAHAPEQIALLRLDTDWYESTRHELIHLYPRLVPGGVLILDDYGYWQGVRQATDEYLSTLDRPPLLCRVDCCACIAVKPG